MTSIKNAWRAYLRAIDEQDGKEISEETCNLKSISLFLSLIFFAYGPWALGAYLISIKFNGLLVLLILFVTSLPAMEISYGKESRNA
jgi:hypothetical protein